MPLRSNIFQRFALSSSLFVEALYVCLAHWERSDDLCLPTLRHYSYSPLPDDRRPRPHLWVTDCPIARRASNRCPPYSRASERHRVCALLTLARPPS